MILMLSAAALVGLGITLVISGWRQPAPDLAATLARLDSLGWAAGGAPERSTARGIDRLVGRLAEFVARELRLSRFHSDLALTGTTPTRLAMEKLGYGFVGLVFPILMATILAVAGLGLPFALPAVAGVALGVAMSFLPEVDLRRRAAEARVQMRRTVCAYLELVALERAADAGAVESLERAGAIGAGPGFDHIRDALLRARLEGRTPWGQLARLSDELAVPELGDVADIMRLSGEDGAAVLPTLRARAASLRTSLLQADVAAANQASERMSIPVALLGVAFMALLGFPALWRILFG